MRRRRFFLSNLRPLGFAHHRPWQEKRSVRKQMGLRNGQEDDKSQRSSRNLDKPLQRPANQRRGQTDRPICNRDAKCSSTGQYPPKRGNGSAACQCEQCKNDRDARHRIQLDCGVPIDKSCAGQIHRGKYDGWNARQAETAQDDKKSPPLKAAAAIINSLAAARGARPSLPIASTIGVRTIDEAGWIEVR